MSLSTPPTAQIHESRATLHTMFKRWAQVDVGLIFGTWHYEITKRIVDVTLSVGLLLVAAPVMLLIAALIKLTSPGPVIFKHRRLGRGGREFSCYKFRSMVVDAEEQLRRRPELQREFTKLFKMKADPRVTRLGAFLRKTSLDELPQLVNVLRDDISLIGPRPIVDAERARYNGFGDRLLSVKPGLSGFWQIYGRSDTTYDQRVEMDMTYIENRSLGYDLKLIFLTAYVVLKGRGAY
jgi:lipopolysaccharide/colanic/teichoic acid biosynthesis glycosyltransferase